MLIIGYGNTLRGDDGAGAIAAEALTHVAGVDADVHVLHQLLPELAVPLASTDFAIFIDAAVDVDPSLPVRVQEIFPASDSTARDTHFTTPAGLLALTRDLYGACPRALLYSIPAENFAFGAPLSERAKFGVERTLEVIAWSGPHAHPPVTHSPHCCDDSTSTSSRRSSCSDSRAAA